MTRVQISSLKTYHEIDKQTTLMQKCLHHAISRDRFALTMSFGPQLATARPGSRHTFLFPKEISLLTGAFSYTVRADHDCDGCSAPTGVLA